MRGSIMQALLLLGVFALGGCNPGTASSPTPTPTAPTTAQPFSTTTPAPGTLRVRNSALASQLAFAFIQANDVWISLYGAPPQQVTHLGLGAQQLGWFLLWSPDQTKLFVDPINPASSAPVSEAWLISLPGDTVQALPPSAPVILSCADHDCAWLEDRYLVHQDESRPGSHSFFFRLYDTQAERDLSTSLDGQQATRMQVRGDSVYFTPYDLAPTSIPGAIKRLDFTSDQITTQFMVPGPLVDEGIPSGSWELSADAREVVEHFSVGISAHCPLTTCSTFYQDMGGTIAVIFPSYQAPAVGGPALFDEPRIAPDGKNTASLISGPDDGYEVVQQALPSGKELLATLPAASAGQAYQIAGWSAQPAGILIQQLPTGAGAPQLTTSIYFVPLGEQGAAQLVETIGTRLVIFAPPPA
jgi:hypothetical protein